MAQGSSDFPIACQSCLGPVPYLQLKKEDYCMKCKLCTQPFTVFGWKPDQDAKFKKTIVCKTCANMRNVCQVCLQGLNHGLPVQARATTAALSINTTDYIPRRDVSRQFFADEHDYRPRDATVTTVYKSSYGRAEPNYTVLRHQRRMPFYQKNTPPVCTFYQRSQCRKGVACPYRHEMATSAELSEHNFDYRYHGSNDPVTLKILRGAAGGLLPKPVQAQGFQEIPSPLFYPNIPQHIQQENTPYPSMPSQRMGSLLPSQPVKLNRDSYRAMQPL